MGLSERLTKARTERTPNWTQVYLLLIFGILLAFGGCGSAILVFKAAYNSSSKIAGAFWIALMVIFGLGLLMLIAAVLSILIIVVRAMIRYGQKPWDKPS
jgi:uncharacterized membrane protein SirB2